MQHLQEQLQAQYRQQQQQQQQNQQSHSGQGQQMMFPGMGLNDPHQQAQFGQANHNPQWGMTAQQGLGDQTNALNSNAAAMAMLQQQQQQMPGMSSNNAGMFNNWQQGGGMQGNQAGMSSGGGTAMDASSASSAQLAAFVGMGMGGQMGNNNMAGNMNAPAGSTSNIQAFLQQQQQAQPPHQQQHGMGIGGQGMQTMGMNHQQQQNLLGQQQQGGHGAMGNATVQSTNANAQMLLQQQLAKLQRQFQGQQQDSSQGGMDSSGQGSDASNSLLQGQHQLLQQMQRQRGSAASLQQLQQQQRGGAANLQQQMAQQQRGNAGNIQAQLAQQQRGSNANLQAQLAQPQQRGSSTSLQQQMASQQQRGGNVGQMADRQSALARLQQMASPSSGQQKQDSANSGLHRNMSNAAMHRDSSAANVHRSSLQTSGSSAQLHGDASKSQMHQSASHASMHRNSSNVGMQAQQQQGGSNQNWIAPAPGNQMQQDSRGLAAMHNQSFQNQFGVGGDSTNAFGGAQSGSLNQQELLMQQLRQQQQQVQQGGMMSDGRHVQTGNANNPNLPQNVQNNFQNLQRHQQQQGEPSGVMGAQMGPNNMGGVHAGGAHSSTSSQDGNAAAQKSFLDGNFAGGWQSNADLPDRRHIIFSILEVIKQMRPDTNKISQKLPHMAKSLEEHLYRSAQTKEEYLDLSTLKKRLQMIAHGLELHRSTSSGSSGPSPKPNDGVSQQQNQQLLQQMADQGLGSTQHMRQGSSQGSVGGGSQDGSTGMGSSFQGNDPLSGAPPPDMSSGGMGDSSSKYQDPIAAQKKKVIRQQQQRLLLLRHASKCTAGPNCKTKFCSQMVTLWKHMKKCRDKNCSTSHCLSSRCVLNHYRICKSQGRTSSCEVCGPVMEQIKRQESGEEAGGVDPLTKDQEMPMLDNPMSMGSSDATQQAQSSGGADQQQLQQLQAAQMKLQNQLQVLKQLQRQQEQLLQQQRHLQEQQSHIKDPHTQQGQQLQQQQALLQQLQQRCQQQQVLLQQELALQSNAINTAKQKQQQQATNQLPSSIDSSQLGAPLQSESQIGAPLQPESAFPKSNSNTNLSQESNNNASSKRGPTSRRQPKAKTAKARGSKGKALSQMDKDCPGSGPKSRLSKISDLDKPANQTKKRAPTKGGKGPSIGMPEPAKKMIKLEPHRSTDEALADALEPAEDELKLHDFGHEMDGDESKQKEISVVVDDNEAKKKLVLDDSQERHAEPYTQVPTVSRESIEKHFESLEKPLGMSPKDVTKACLPLVQDLIDDPFGWVFRDPVDPVALGLPDYFEVVKKPMHLELVKTKLENNEYPDMESFQKDVSLVFENSILYNGESSEVGQLALTMLSNFAEKYEASMKETDLHAVEQRDTCSLCGQQSRHAPTNALFCIGSKCGMQRIPPGSTCYSDPAHHNHLCVSCYSDLEDNAVIVLDDGSSAIKDDFNCSDVSQAEEAFLRCGNCQHTVHQVCALVDSKDDTTGTYLCPNCKVKILDSPLRAGDLPKTKLSTAIESGLQKALSSEYEEKDKSAGEVHGLSVRVVSNIDTKQYNVDNMQQMLPPELPLRSKCIALFQTIEGVDVLLFVLFVREYGSDCPARNRNRAYISYLESSGYLEPMCYKTVVYQSILIEYLRFLKNRGFHEAHIWSCSATPREDMIFATNQNDATSDKEKLRVWFESMLDKAAGQGAVSARSNLFDEFCRDGLMESFPLFEGDYVFLEMEEETKGLPTDARSLEDSSGKDDISPKLRGAISKMKDSLIVVHLLDQDPELKESLSKRPRVGMGNDEQIQADTNAKGPKSLEVDEILEDHVASDGGPLSEEKALTKETEAGAMADPKETSTSEEAKPPKHQEASELGGVDRNLSVPSAGALAKMDEKSLENGEKVAGISSQVGEDSLSAMAADIKEPETNSAPKVADGVSADNGKAEEIKPEQKIHSAPSDGVSGVPSDGEKQEGCTEEKPTKDENQQAGTKGFVDENPKEDPTDRGSKEGVMDKASKEDLVDNDSKENPVDKDSKGDPMNEDAKMDPVDKDSNENLMGDELKEGPNEKGYEVSKEAWNERSNGALSSGEDTQQQDQAQPRETLKGLEGKETPETSSGIPVNQISEEDAMTGGKPKEGGKEHTLQADGPGKTSDHTLKELSGEKPNGCVEKNSSQIIPGEMLEDVKKKSSISNELQTGGGGLGIFRQTREVASQGKEETERNTSGRVDRAAEEGLQYVEGSSVPSLEGVQYVEGSSVPSLEQTHQNRTIASRNNPVSGVPQVDVDPSKQEESTDRRIESSATHEPRDDIQSPKEMETNEGEGTNAAKRSLLREGAQVDPDRPIESWMFESRVHFLKFCLDNRYQFDELRRAKYSTVKLLEHMNETSVDQWSKTSDGVVHVLSCGGPPSCQQDECCKGRELLEHLAKCPVRIKSECKMCLKALALVGVHARLCSGGSSCKIPFCENLRERDRRMRQLKRSLDVEKLKRENESYK